MSPESTQYVSKTTANLIHLNRKLEMTFLNKSTFIGKSFNCVTLAQAKHIRVNSTTMEITKKKQRKQLKNIPEI